MLIVNNNGFCSRMYLHCKGNASSIFKKMMLRNAIEWIIQPEWYEVRKNSGCDTIASSIFIKMALKIEHNINMKPGRIPAVIQLQAASL